MTADGGRSRTIIVKKITIEDEHHGGAWKIALADMMTAMMAFFLVLWLISATDTDTLKGIADHFKDTSAASEPRNAGSDGFFGGVSVVVPLDVMPESSSDLRQQDVGRSDTDPSSELAEDADLSAIVEEVEQAAFQEIEDKISDVISRDPTLAPAMNKVEFIREKDGMRIQIVDDEDSSMFELGTYVFLPSAERLLSEISAVIASVPNDIVIRGHTDSLRFVDSSVRNNWILSAERAEATRSVLQDSGVAKERFVKIEGVADVDPYVESDPADPRNRRINIILKYQAQ